MNIKTENHKLNLNGYILFGALILILIINSIFQLNNLLDSNYLNNFIGSNIDRYRFLLIAFSIISQTIIAIITIIFDLLLIFIMIKFICKSKNTLGSILPIILISNIVSTLTNITQSIMFKDIFIQNIDNIVVSLPSNIFKMVTILYLLVKFNFINVNNKFRNCLIIGISYFIITFSSYFVMIKTIV